MIIINYYMFSTEKGSILTLDVIKTKPIVTSFVLKQENKKLLLETTKWTDLKFQEKGILYKDSLLEIRNYSFRASH